MDKNTSMIEFLLRCPTIQENPLFFNFAYVEDGNNHMITEKDIKKRPYIDGSVLKQYTFTIASYCAVVHNAIVGDNTNNTFLDDINVDNMAKVQAILDWIDEEAEKLPDTNILDFGPDCEIESMETLTVDPDIDGIDTSVNPPIARYSIGVRVTYLDKSKQIWK